MSRRVAAVLILVLLFLLPFAFLAAADDAAGHTSGASEAASTATEDRGAGYLPYSDPTPLGSGGLFGAVVRTIFSLAIVLGLLYATLWVIKKITGSAVGSYSQGAVRVVGRIYLSPKVVVYFVRLMDRMLIIGASAGAVSLLTTVEDAHEITQIEDALKGVHASGPGFSRFFDRSMNRFQKAMDRDESVFDEQLHNLNEQIGRLKGLARKRQRDDE